MDNSLDKITQSINEHKHTYTIGVIIAIILLLILLVIWLAPSATKSRPATDNDNEPEIANQTANHIAIDGLYILKQASYNENQILIIRQGILKYFQDNFPEYKQIDFDANSMVKQQNITNIKLTANTSVSYNLKLDSRLQTYELYRENEANRVFKGDLDCNQVTSYKDQTLAACIPHYGKYMKVIAEDLSLTKPKLTVYILIPFRDAPDKEQKDQIERATKVDFADWVAAKGANINDYEITYKTEWGRF